MKAKANDCFAMAKDSPYTDVTDKHKAQDIATCYVLKEVEFKRMQRGGLCGTNGCPFYKKSRTLNRTW